MVAKKYKISIAIGLGLYMIGYIPTRAVNVSPGSTFTVSVSCGTVEGSVKATGSNATVTSTSSSWCDRGSNINITAKAGNVGKATVSLIGVDATGNANTPNPVDYTGKVIGSSFVNVLSSSPGSTPVKPTPQPTKPQVQQQQQQQQQPANVDTSKSSDNTLSSLTVSSGTLHPVFSPSVNVYNLAVTNDITSIDVGAKPKSAQATVSGIGNKPLTAGKNKIVVSVKAENGATNEYTIHVSVNEKSEIYLDYNGVKLGVVRNLDDVAPPNKQFDKTTVKIGEKDVTAWKNNVINKTIVYLIDEATGTKNFYIYNTTTNKVETVFKPMSILGQRLYIVDVDKALQTREGMKFGTVKIDKDELQGWSFNDAALKNYALIYVMNEKGEMVYYQYEDTEKTLQLYPTTTTKPVGKQEESANVKKMEDSLKQKDRIIYALVGVSGLLFILSIVFFLQKGKKIKHQKIDLNHKQFDEGFHIEKDALEQDEDE